MAGTGNHKGKKVVFHNGNFIFLVTKHERDKNAKPKIYSHITASSKFKNQNFRQWRALSEHEESNTHFPSSLWHYLKLLVLLGNIKASLQ